MTKTTVTVRLSKAEKERLEEYADQQSRTMTEVIREFIRGLNVLK